MTETKTLAMLRAVNDAIESVRAEHSGIPEVVVVLGSSGRKKKSQTHGHFAARAWAERETGERTHEIFLSGESLRRGGKETMGTIIHELAHAYCNENKIEDTSNRGRYHNVKFKDVAESFGLVIEKAPTIGHSVTIVPEHTAAAYGKEIDVLDAALTLYRDHVEVEAAPKAKKYTMQCPECKDPVPTGKKWFERNSGKLICDEHGEQFEFIEEGGEDD